MAQLIKYRAVAIFPEENPEATSLPIPSIAAARA